VTDAELIARVLNADDRAAFGLLVQRYQSAVRQFLRHLTAGDTAWADDLAQETFIQAYLNLNQFYGESSLSTWLFGIAHNHYRNSQRHFLRRRNISVPMPPDESTFGNAPNPPITADLHHDLAAAMEKLPVDQKTAIHLCYHQGLTHVEAAAVLDCPPGTLKTNLARGKDQLRNLLAAWKT